MVMEGKNEWIKDNRLMGEVQGGFRRGGRT